MNKIMNKNILFIGPENDKGGMGSVLNIYEKYLPGSKFISTYPASIESSKLLYFLKSIVKILKLFSFNSQIKIVHIHCASKGSFIRKSIICVISKLYNKKTIMHMHGGGFKDYYHFGINKYFVRFILSISDKTICLSDEWNVFYKGIIQENKITVLGNPVEDFKNIMNLDENNNLIKMLFLGKICEEKGIYELIEYLYTNKHFKENKIKLTIGGIGNIDKLESIIKDNINIRYVGWITKEEKLKHISDCNLLILPSHHEGLPISILEAMSAGKPIISTNVGGVPSIVKENHNGWLFNVHELEKLDEIFTEIFNNNEIIRIYGNNSYKESMKFHPNNIINKLEETYENIC
jgi:glycosyltransferase involved in cell wall biosynthesis